MTDFYAHSGNDHDRWHLLREHLQSVGDLARRFSEENNIALKDAAY